MKRVRTNSSAGEPSRRVTIPSNLTGEPARSIRALRAWSDHTPAATAASVTRSPVSSAGPANPALSERRAAA
ncbi:MAG: hypothetical protein ACRDHH_05015 [Actinomycetota bacterium]